MLHAKRVAAAVAQAVHDATPATSILDARLTQTMVMSMMVLETSPPPLSMLPGIREWSHCVFIAFAVTRRGGQSHGAGRCGALAAAVLVPVTAGRVVVVRSLAPRPVGTLRRCAAAPVASGGGGFGHASRRPWGPSRCRAGGARECEPDRPGVLDGACDQEGRNIPPPDGRDRAAHHVLAVPQAEQAALPRSPDGCAVGWEPLRAGSRRRRLRAEGDGGATSILGGGRPQSSARPLRRPRQDRSSTKPRQAGASEPMTRKMLDSEP